MMDVFLRAEVRKLIDREFSHIKFPPAIMAEVTAMSKIGDKTWRYNLKPLRSDRSAAEFPEIPAIKSHIEVEAGIGGIVAVALLYGQMRPVIIDEVIS